jgi:Family of unknown function (DUF6214)
LVRRTVSFAGGITATYDPASGRVQVGDRWVPPRIIVHSAGSANEPDLRMMIEVRQGIPVYTEVTLHARPDGPEVRRRDLDIPLDGWLEQIVAACSLIARGIDASGNWTTLVQPIEDRAALTNVRRARSGRPRIPQERLQEVADVYREHIEERPTEAVSRAFGVSHRTAARYVQQAREAGLLPDTTPGKRKA